MLLDEFAALLGVPPLEAFDDAVVLAVEAGAARGILVVAVGLLFFSWLVGPNPPAWISEAKSLPLLQGVGEWLEGLLPDDPENTILDRLKTGDEPGAQPEN